MADAALSFVVERLGDLLMEKARSLRNIRGNVQRLKNELIHMQGFLKEADARPHPENRVKQNLVAEIRDLAHDAEDIIESYVLATESASEGCCLTTAPLRMYNSWNVASEIDGFTSRINDLGGRLQRYGSGIIIREAGEYRSGTTQQNSLHPLRRTYSHKPDEQHDVIGLEEDAEKIATKLVDGTLQSRTVSIWGMGGIGKTTLAKKVYHNTQVVRHFDNRVAWGSVSQQHKERDIWLNILTKLASPDKSERRFSELPDGQIVNELRELLMKEKCLIVLDDIWTKDAWDCLRAGFPEANNTQSKILLTTRNKDVALHVDRDCFILSPGLLNESQSWELFHSVAIRPREEAGFTFDEKLEELGIRIVNRCAGLPLAIKTIGGNLLTKSSIDEWTMVHDNMVSHLRGIDKGMMEQGVMNLLALSYHDLPYDLKQCFLHFSHFPEDFIIPTNTIINIWVAEGIIPKGSRWDEVEDIAYAYLENLVSRCMIQVEKRSSIGRIKSCRLHDLMRELCIQESNKENFVRLENGHDDEATMQAASIGNVRHLALYMKNSNQGLHLNFDIYDHVRSLLVFYNNMDPVVLNKSLTRHSKYLRLLYLNGDELDLETLEEIGHLVHLRLLDMGSVRTKRLPSSLSKLTRLLTLKLDGLLNVDHMPNIIGNMHQLRHLYLPVSANFSNMKLSQLKSLQTLVNLPLKYVRIEDLVRLPRLRKLKLKVSDKDEFNRLHEMLYTSLNTTFKKLQSLSVSLSWREVTTKITKVAATCPHLHKLKFKGPLMLDLPEKPQIFHHLGKLTLKSSNFVEDPMPHLGKLPKLRVLHLNSALGIDKVWFPKKSFPHLQSLVLKWEKQLKEWIIEDGALPCVSVLQLDYCDNLKTLPKGLEFVVDSLQEVLIGAMPNQFIEKIMDSHIAKIVRLRWDYVAYPLYYQIPPYPYAQIFTDENQNQCTIV